MIPAANAPLLAVVPVVRLRLYLRKGVFLYIITTKGIIEKKNL